jgi:hypothetical protein
MAAAAKKADSATKETKAMDVTFKALIGLEPEIQLRVLAWLPQVLKLPTVPVAPAAPGSPARPGTPVVLATPALAGTPGSQAHARSFMTLKRPRNMQERIACLAFYLTFFKDMPSFKTRGISQMNSEAGQSNLSNPAMFMKNAVKVQYLSSAGKGARQLTPRGEALVNGLPDRDKVAQALVDHPLSGRRKKGTKKKKAAKVGS